MSCKNTLLKKMQRTVDTEIRRSKNVHTQMCLDAAMIAANDVLHMGAGRCEAFAAAFSESLSEIAETTITDTPDVEYSKTVLDRRLKQICGDKFVPWEERYK